MVSHVRILEIHRKNRIENEPFQMREKKGERRAKERCERLMSSHTVQLTQKSKNALNHRDTRCKTHGEPTKKKKKRNPEYKSIEIGTEHFVLNILDGNATQR